MNGFVHAVEEGDTYYFPWLIDLHPDQEYYSDELEQLNTNVMNMLLSKLGTFSAEASKQVRKKQKEAKAFMDPCLKICMLIRLYNLRDCDEVTVSQECIETSIRVLRHVMVPLVNGKPGWVHIADPLPAMMRLVWSKMVAEREDFEPMLFGEFDDIIGRKRKRRRSTPVDNLDVEVVLPAAASAAEENESARKELKRKKARIVSDTVLEMHKKRARNVRTAIIGQFNETDDDGRAYLTCLMLMLDMIRFMTKIKRDNGLMSLFGEPGQILNWFFMEEVYQHSGRTRHKSKHFAKLAYDNFEFSLMLMRDESSENVFNSWKVDPFETYIREYIAVLDKFPFLIKPRTLECLLEGLRHMRVRMHLSPQLFHVENEAASLARVRRLNRIRINFPVDCEVINKIVESKPNVSEIDRGNNDDEAQIRAAETIRRRNLEHTIRNGARDCGYTPVDR